MCPCSSKLRYSKLRRARVRSFLFFYSSDLTWHFQFLFYRFTLLYDKYETNTPNDNANKDHDNSLISKFRLNRILMTMPIATKTTEERALFALNSDTPK